MNYCYIWVVFSLLHCLHAGPTTISTSTVIHTDTTSVTNGQGIVYCSYDNGVTWADLSNGLPPAINLTDMAVSGDHLAISTKQNGIFFYHFEKNTWVITPENPTTTANIDVLYFFKNTLYAGTQNEGIFYSNDQGQSWFPENNGLGNLTIRRFAEINNHLYAGTNGGLYVLNETDHTWELVYGHNALQVNGMTALDGDIYIGTNQGVFKKAPDQTAWKQVLPGHSLHHIGRGQHDLYALTYNELLVSTDGGNTWVSDQAGMPAGKYSFQIVPKDETLFVAQWDGIYKKEGSNNWTLSSDGLPTNFPVTELKTYQNIMVAASSGWFQK